jgi:hypothetical protein
MKVWDLLILLQKMPMDKEVVVSTENGYEPVETVYENESAKVVVIL